MIRSTHGSILCMAMALGLCLIPIRALTVGFDRWSLKRPFEEIPKIVLSACYDLLLVGLMAAAFLVIARLVRSGRWQKAIVCTFALLCTVLLLIGLANIEIVRMLGRPFNYRWLYYSDFLRNPDAIHSIRTAMDWRAAAAAIWACAAMFVLARLLRLAWGIFERLGMQRSTVLAGALPLLGAYFFFAHWFLTTQRWPAGKLANPVCEFAFSLVRSAKAPALFTMNTPVPPDEFHPPPLEPQARDADIRNVIFFVLESVPAEYVQAYGGKYPVTPNLNRYLDRAVVFENIYAHAPATNKSLVSLLCSVYPWVSYRTLTQDHPDAPLESLSAVLRRHGMRNGFFASGDLVYQGAGKFLAHRGFDEIQDYRQRRGTPGFESRDYPYLNGTDDRATVSSLLQWIDQRQRQPFFAMLWTLTTHHPYFCAGPLVDYSPDESFNRYLNALRHGDEALGELLAALEQRKLLDSTLVVVVGDHGEAFGRHNQWGHGTQIYEENLRVPLVMINPTRFAGQRVSQLGGLVDVAPTVTDLLGAASPKGWQGRSLFAPNRSGRVYFFAPWSDFMFGYREGDWKLIYNATTDHTEVYDLKNDPHESRNLAASHPRFVQRGLEHVAAWVQYQTQFYARATAAPAPGTASAGEP